MSILLPMLSFMALSAASLVFAPTNRALVEANVGLVMAATLAWLLLFWTTALVLAWPLVTKLLQTSPLIIQLLQFLQY